MNKKSAVDKISVPIIEKHSKYWVDNSSLAPSIIFLLKNASATPNQFILIKDLISSDILSEEDLPNGCFPDDYLIPSDIFRQPELLNLQFFQSDKKDVDGITKRGNSGNAGNISLSYRSFKKRSNKLDNYLSEKFGYETIKKIDLKILTKENYDKIKNIRNEDIKIYFQSKNENKIEILSFNGNIKKLVECFNKHIKNDFVPFRFVIENVGILDLIGFYLKNINSKIKAIMDRDILQYFESNAISVIKKSTNNLPGFCVPTERTSNNKFYVNEKNSKIYKICNKVQFFRIKNFNNGQIINVDNLAFYLPQIYSLSDIFLLDDPLIDESLNSNIKNIDYLDVLNHKYKLFNDEGKLDESNKLKIIQHFLLEVIPEINMNIFESFQEISKINYIKQDMKNVELLTNEMNFFYVSKETLFDGYSFKTRNVLIKGLNGIKFVLNKRSQENFSVKKVCNDVGQMVDWFFLNNKNMAHEREKVASVIFMEKLGLFLINNDYHDIVFELEKQVIKSNNKAGYIDLIVECTKAGRRFVTAFEFKAMDDTKGNRQMMNNQAHGYGELFSDGNIPFKIEGDLSLQYDELNHHVIPLNLNCNLENIIFSEIKKK